MSASATDTHRAVVIDGRDNVATVVADVPVGATVVLEGGSGMLAAREAIPFGHKLAVRAIAAGEPVVKYGEAMGRATADIAAGAHVHVHNVESERARGDRS
jgi:altronate dehydratase small subunit